MVVTMSRDICVRLYDEIIKIKPKWHSNDTVNSGEIKVVMTSSASDESHMQSHHTSKDEKKVLEKRFKNPEDSLKIVLVRDMWLTGFDAPCLTTMYIDKPMQGSNLAQAIARVNRVFSDKPGGLIVDYIGIAPQLKEALATYTAGKGKGRPTLDISEAFNILLEKILVARDLLHPVDWSKFKENALKLLPECIDHILNLEDGRKRYCDVVLQITKAYALCSTLREAMELTPEIAFHQAIRAPLIKSSRKGGLGKYEDPDYKLKQLVSESLVAGGVTIYLKSQIETPDISILSDEFLNEVLNIPQKNLAIDLLDKLIKDEIKSKFRKNIVQTEKV